MARSTNAFMSLHCCVANMSLKLSKSTWYVFRVLHLDMIQKSIVGRNAARKAKDFKESDRIRDDLKARGVVLEDSAKGTTWKRA